ncbi:MAG: universal stress protein [Vicinamibacterales bacterium]
MFSTLVVASDGSDTSDRIVDCLGHLRRVGAERVVLIHVFDVRHVGGLYESLRPAMEARLGTQRQVLEREGYEVQIETPLGIPFYEINAAGQRHDASALVVGSLGQSLVADITLGSTAHEVLHHATRPVLLLRVQATPGDTAQRCRVVCGDLFSHTLFPTDFSDTAERAFLHLEHVVRETHGRVTLLHVQDRARLERHLSERLDEFNKIDQERLDRLKTRLESCGAAHVDTDIPYGSPIEILLQRLRTGAVSLVVMGTQGRGFIHEVLMGSVAGVMARLAPVPVLFVPGIR